MTGQQLKNSILQMAVQGKLVPQDPNDEPASVLLERIRKEKEQLIKEGKIKIDKHESFIFKKNNSYYEKRGSEIVCIDGEIPFDIPDSWQWVKLKNLVRKEIKRGKSPKYADGGNVYVFAQKCNVKLGGIDVSLAKFLDMKAFEKYPIEEYMVNEDIIINSTGNGTLGRIGMFRDTDRINDFVIVPDSHVTIIRACDQLKKDYLFYVLKYYQPYLEKAGEGSTNQTELHPSTIAELFVPLPPACEQERIIAKLLKVLHYVDVYGEKEKALQSYNADFPKQLKKSILQEAVRGNLVSQDENDEPASVLLERIRAEKQKLIAEGKIKKINESVIFRRDNSYYEKLDGTECCIDDEIPFDIPESWCWCRLNTLGITQTGNTPSKTHPEYIGKDISFITPGDIQNGSICYNNQALSFLGKDVARVCSPNSVLQVCIGGSIGKAAITTAEVTFNQQINAISPLVVNTEFVYVVMQSVYFLKNIKEQAGGTATPIINRGVWDLLLIPLPPLAEQHRIVDKIKELLSLCNNP